jgi:hypothetical protein
MKTVLFKNNATFIITDEDASTIHNRIINGAQKFQCFHKEGSDHSEYIINLEEVVLIS